MLLVLTVFSALSFYGYGISCILSRRMVAEFRRYGLARYRVLTGALQIIGATGLVCGLAGFSQIGFWAAVGLSLQMFSGLIVRIRIRDHCIQCLPSILYLCLNAIIAFLFMAV